MPMQFKDMMLQFWSEHETNKLRFLKTHLETNIFKNILNDHINVHEKTTQYIHLGVFSNFFL
jgi:hypothetical protein